jgi:GR25 family glycosyltransferase involved in LPS biosynthesis
MTVKINDRYIADGGFYINLDSRIDRKEKVEQQLSKFNITGVQRMPAVIKGQYAGCGESHKNIIKTAIANNMKSVLVFEDDFYIMDPPSDGFKPTEQTFTDLFIDILDQADTVDWDVLFFGTILHSPLDRVTKNLGKIKSAKSAHAFIIKESLYEYILNWSYEQYDQLDHYFYTTLQKSHTFLTTHPALINHGHPNEDFSDLLKRNTTYYYYLLSTYQEFCKDFHEQQYIDSRVS